MNLRHDQSGHGRHLKQASSIVLAALCVAAGVKVVAQEDAKDPNMSLVFTNKAELLKWNTYKLPLGTNVTTQLFDVPKTNDLVVLVPTNQVSKLLQEGRVTNVNGKIDPVEPKSPK